MYYLVASEYSGGVLVIEASCPAEAIENGRGNGMVGTLNAVQIASAEEARQRITRLVGEIERDCSDYNSRHEGGCIRWFRLEAIELMEKFFAGRWSFHRDRTLQRLLLTVGPWDLVFLPYKNAESNEWSVEVMP